MNKKTIRAFCILLVLCCFLPVFAGCKGKDTDGPIGTTDPGVNDGNLYDANGYIKDALPALDYNAAQLTVLTWNPALDELCMTREDTGNLIDDAMFRQITSVENRLNVDIKVKQIPGLQDNSDEYIQDIENASMGDTPYDAVGAYSGIGAAAAMKGLYYDLNSMPYIDFQKPWWPDDLQNSIAVKDKLYFASGDISPNLIYGLFAVLINLDLLDEYFHDRELIYDLVDNNEWTLDKLLEMASAVSRDVNNIGTVDESDIFGFIFANSVTIDCFLQGSGIDITERNSEGAFVMAKSFFSSQADDVVTKLAALVKSDNCYIPDSDQYNGNFPDGRSMMLAGKIEACITHLSNAQFKYGVAPIPKYDSQQKSHVTTMNHNFSVYGIPRALTTDAANRSAALLEAMASQAYRSVTPIIFEKAFQLKYSSSARVAEMFDLVRNGVKFDMARLYRLNFSTVPDTKFRDAVRQDLAWITTVSGQRTRWDLILDRIQTELAK